MSFNLGILGSKTGDGENTVPLSQSESEESEGSERQADSWKDPEAVHVE